MAVVASYLADTSALAGLRHHPVAAVLGPLIEAGLVATCGVVEFELGWAARSGKEPDDLRADRDVGYEWLPTRDEDWREALDVRAALWRRGQFRAVGLPALLVAAVAGRERVTVLHYDSDYDFIAGVTGQLVLWVVPRGTVPDYAYAYRIEVPQPVRAPAVWPGRERTVTCTDARRRTRCLLFASKGSGV